MKKIFAVFATKFQGTYCGLFVKINEISIVNILKTHVYLLLIYSGVVWMAWLVKLT